MGAYEYTALDAAGKTHKGIQEGDTPRQIRQSLKLQGLIPTTVEAIQQRAYKKEEPTGFSAIKQQKRVGVKDLASMTRQLATLIEAGFPVEESLAVTARQSSKPHVKSVLLGVRAMVLEGHSMANSLAAFPKVFPELYCSTVRAGEQSGHLDNVLLRLADYTEDRQALTQRITMAMVYPGVLTLVAIVIVALLMGYVVPQVVQVLQGSGEQLPLSTRILLTGSDIIVQYGVYMLLAVIAIIVGFRQALKNPAFRYQVDRLLLKIPLISGLVTRLNTARFTRTFSILSASGVPVIDAMNISAEVLTNSPMRKAVLRATDRVREGKPIHLSLEKSGYFPPLITSLIASGESSGKLDDMLQRAALSQEQELESSISIMLNLFEPAMIIVMALIVLFIVLSILTPIIELNNLIK
ncbi:MAG: type II secretion system inner membrane protein GspF [Gammaproteobacteria bacterium]|nr:MAG: type II secretion system inner membrane protein GspF [Gammaproteobacteria bacterium]